jgi:hypothetical protein
MLQEHLSYTCSFKDYVAVIDDVLPCELISIMDFCDESPVKLPLFIVEIQNKSDSSAIQTVKTL